MGFSGASGDPAFTALVAKLSAIEEYRVLFALMYGDAMITETRVQNALAQFVRSIQSFDSRYDQGRAQVAGDNVNFPNFSASENAGKQLFLTPPGGGGAGCAGCHRAPEFDIDPNSRNNGVTSKIGGGTDLTNVRSPSLRDLERPGGTLNGGLMHDGSFNRLLSVINHYAAIPGDNANLDNRLRRPGGNVQALNLTAQQRNDLVAFLRTLTGTAVYTDPKWSSPFNASGALDLIIISSSAITFQPNGNGTATLRCKAAPGLSYQLQSSPSPAATGTWTNVTTVTADANGVLLHTLNVSGGSSFFRFTYTPPAS
jgi:cytochrome c peroxidase